MQIRITRPDGSHPKHGGLNRTVRAAATVTLGLVMTSVAVHAQRTPPDSTRPSVVAPVVVTVLRTPVDVAKAPYAVGSTGIFEIQRGRPGLAADEALNTIPGVQVDNRFNFALGERISIRGFGARSQFGVRGLKVLIDGIPATLPDGQTTLNHLDLGTLGRAEVIRGPAAALYGNASGGVVQFESQPAANVPIAQELRMLWGRGFNPDLLWSDGDGEAWSRVQSTTSGRNGNRSYLFSLSRVRYDGFRTWDDADNWHFNSSLQIGERDNGVGIVVNGVDYTAKNPGSLNDSLLRVQRDSAFRNNVNQKTGESGRQGQLGITWRRPVAGGGLSVAAHVLRRELDNPIPPRIIGLTRGAGGVRASFGAPFPGVANTQWIAGAELELQRDARTNNVNSGGTRGALNLDQKEHVTSTGLFAQFISQPHERVDLIGGLRYDRLKFAVEDRLISASNPDDSGDRTMSAISPSLGVSLAVRPTWHVYANAGTSFETPTTTELANRPTGAGGFNPELDPQRTLSVEIGTKGVLGARATYQVALFRAAVDDALIPFEVPSFPGRVFYRNAGTAVHRGIEAGASVNIVSTVDARIAYAYTDATFDEYTVGTTSFAGKRIPGVAPHRVDAAFNAAVGSRGYVNVDARYSSEVFADDANTARSPSYTILGARGGLDYTRVGRVEVAPFVGITNLFATKYNASVVINAAGARFFEPAPGRALYAGMNLMIGR